MKLAILLVTVVAQTAFGAFFESAGLQDRPNCESLSRNDCLFYHEAKDDKCVDVCEKKIKEDESDTTASPDGTTPQGDPEDGKKKKGGKCFHGDDSVITNQGQMKMRDLVGREDIQVLSRGSDNKLQMSPIFSWLHLNEAKEATFLIMSTESGRQISITPTHLIQSTKCNGVERVSFAMKVQEGECLLVRDDNGELKESKIVRVVEEVKKGIYAPLTENGNIVVNDILASCYTDFENEELQKLIFNFLNSVRSAFNYVVPSNVVEMIYNTPFDTVVRVPQVFLSFIDLAKTCVN